MAPSEPNRCGDCGCPDRSNGVWTAWTYQFDSFLCLDCYERRDVRRERAMTLEGLGIGLLAGTLVAVIASPDWVDDNGECTTLPCVAYKVSPNVGTRVEVLGLLGAFVGGIVGSSAKKVTWAPVQVDGLQVGRAPDGGLAVGMRISF